MIDHRNKEIGQRLKKAREVAGYRFAADAAQALGIKYPTYAAHENGGRAVVRSLDLYSRRYKVSLDWLLTGKGNMKLGGEDGDESPDITHVPLISSVSAGQPFFQEGIDDVSDFPTIAVYDLPKGEWVALRVDGLSMSKISPPDSIILVNMADKELITNAYYIIMDEEGQVTYKRYRPHEKPPFQPFSYQDIKPPALQGDITIIGRVRRTIIDM